MIPDEPTDEQIQRLVDACPQAEQVADYVGLANHYECIAMDCEALAAEAESVLVSMRKQARTARTRAAKMREAAGALTDGSKCVP